MTRIPLLSIVTPCLNRAAFIDQAMESVAQQDYPHIEHIIMDGGSTDGTLDLLATYSNLNVVSEPDRGVYDGLNKGISMSKGEIIGQLNTDDYYPPTILKKIMGIFEENPGVDAICGSARVFELDLEKQEHDVALYQPIDNRDFPMRITSGVPIFNAWFFRRRVFEKIGPYSLEYPLMADRDFLIRCYLGGLKILPIGTLVYNYRRHPGSLTINSNYSVSLLREALQLSKSYLEQKRSDSVIKRNCMEWHDHTSIEMLIYNARSGKISETLKVLRNAIAANPLWPFVAIKQIPARTLNYLRKHYVSHS